MKRMLCIIIAALCLCSCNRKVEDVPVQEHLELVGLTSLEEETEKPVSTISLKGIIAEAEEREFCVSEQLESSLPCVLVYETELAEEGNVFSEKFGWDVVFCEYDTTEAAETCFAEYEKQYPDGLKQGSTYMKPTPHGLFVCFYRENVIGHGIINTDYSDKVVSFLSSL